VRCVLYSILKHLQTKRENHLRCWLVFGNIIIKFEYDYEANLVKFRLKIPPIKSFWSIVWKLLKYNKNRSDVTNETFIKNFNFKVDCRIIALILFFYNFYSAEKCIVNNLRYIYVFLYFYLVFYQLQIVFSLHIILMIFC